MNDHNDISVQETGNVYLITVPKSCIHDPDNNFVFVWVDTEDGRRCIDKIHLAPGLEDETYI